MKDYDVLVIGGGPAGATAALALARAGRSVALVEKHRFPRRKVCGEFLSATNAALLERLGLGHAWRRLAGPEIRRVGLFVGEVAAAAPMPRADGFGRALGRDVLDTLLLEAAGAAGVEVLQPWRALTLRRDGRGQRLLAGTKGRRLELRASAVVAAHGSWEPGGLPTQLVRRAAASDLLGFKAHFRCARLAPDLMPLLAFPGGYGGLVTADQGRLSLSCCIRRDVLEARRRDAGGGPAGAALRRHLERTSRGLHEALAGADILGPWLAAGPIRPGLRACYADDLFRVGNLAGEAHPIVAEGISMAIQGSWLLAEELSAIDPWDPAARARAGARYAAAWRAQFAARVRAAALFARLALSPPGVAVATALLSAVPGLLTLGAAWSGKARPLAPRSSTP